MRNTLLALLLCSTALAPFAVRAQAIADPTTWTYEVKKTGANEYELYFNVALKEGWHIFSLQPGDEFLIPPSFDFSKDAGMKLRGKVQESGNKHTEQMDGVDNAVSYYEGAATFVQKISVRAPAKITGQHEYQVCNNAMCLPPKKKPFVFSITQ